MTSITTYDHQRRDFWTRFYLGMTYFFYHQNKTCTSEMLNQQEVQQLFQKLAKGSPEAYTEIFNKFTDHVYHSALSIIGNEQDARDITQEIFAKLWTDRERDIKHPVTYLAKAAANHAIDLIRKRKREEEKHLGSSVIQDTVQPPSEYGNNDLSQEEKLMMAINQMPPKQARIYTELKFNNKTRQEVADQEQLQLSTIDSYISSARRFIVEAFKKKS